MARYPYSRQRGLLMLCSFVLLFTGNCFANTFEWNGTSSTWTSASSWTKLSGTGSSTYPGEGSATGDIAEIGVTVYTSGVNPILSSPLTIAAINFGGNSGNAMSLTVNAALTVTGTITQKHNNNIPGGVTTTLGGTGTITCAAFKDGDATSPGNGGGSNSLTYYTTINCSVNLTISGALTLNSTSKSHGQNTNFSNPIFNLLSGDLSVNNIITSATSFVSGNTETFNIVLGSTNGLTILGQTSSPITISSGGQVNFSSGSGTDLSTVTYGASSGTQLIYASSYPHLVLSGNSTKTADGGTLTIGESWTTSGGSVDLKTNSTVVSVAGSWTNSAAVTQGSANISVYGDVSNSSEGSLTLGTGTFTLSGNFSNNGTFSQSTGNMIFNGASTALNDGGTGTVFRNVFFNGGGTTLINSGDFAISAAGILTLANSTILNANNHLSLLSNASASAAIGVIPTGSSITGKINVQRYITGNSSSTYRSYRLLCSPVNATSATSNQNNFTSLAYLNANGTFGATTYNGAFTGGPGTGFSFYNGNPTIYLYKETLPVNNNYYISGKHVGISSITGNTVTTVSNATGTVVYTPGVSIPAGNGFLMYFVGPNTRNTASSLIPPADAVLTANGLVNQGDVPVYLWFTPSQGAGYLSYTSSLGTSAAGYNMVGNPYACTIDLSKVLTDNAGTTGIDNIYVLSPIGPSQSYAVYTLYGSSSPSSYYAASGQGFIVHATGSASQLKFKETEKSATTQPTGAQLMMGTPKQEAALTGLYLKLEKDSLHYDYCGIYFRNDWSDAFENGDALYMSGNSINMASLSSDGRTAAVNHLSTYTNDNRIRLYTNAQLGGDYTLKIEGIRNIDTTYDIYLVDHYKQDSVNIRKTGAYAFSILKTDTASFGANRFVLAIHKNPAYAYRLLSFTAQQVAHSPHVQLIWKTQNELNNNFTVERSNDGGNTFAVAGGLQGTGAGLYGLTDKNAMDGQNLYRLKSEDINNNVTYSPVVEVMISPNGNAEKIRLYPNPATSTVNLDVLDKTTGNISYNITVSNSTGFIVKQVTSSQPKWQADVSALLPGTYLIRVVNSKTQSFIAESKLVKL